MDEANITEHVYQQYRTTQSTEDVNIMNIHQIWWSMTKRLSMWNCMTLYAWLSKPLLSLPTTKLLKIPISGCWASMDSGDGSWGFLSLNMVLASHAERHKELGITGLDGRSSGYEMISTCINHPVIFFPPMIPFQLAWWDWRSWSFSVVMGSLRQICREQSHPRPNPVEYARICLFDMMIWNVDSYDTHEYLIIYNAWNPPKPLFGLEKTSFKSLQLKIDDKWVPGITWYSIFMKERHTHTQIYILLDGGLKLSKTWTRNGSSSPR